MTISIIPFEVGSLFVCLFVLFFLLAFVAKFFKVETGIFFCLQRIYFYFSKVGKFSRDDEIQISFYSYFSR